jgi:putative transposase
MKALRFSTRSSTVLSGCAGRSEKSALLVLMHREGWDVGKQPFYRVYTEEGLALRRKRPWRRATAVHREQRRPAMARDEIWSMDFVADQLADGRRFRTTVIDLFTRPGDRRRPGAEWRGCGGDT